METKKDHAGIYLPPPVIYAAIFILAWFIQKVIPINNALIEKDATKFVGILFLLLALYLGLRGVERFIKTGNTIVTMRPTSSLQQAGVYKFTRNPMYLGMISGYLGLTCFLEIGGTLFCFQYLLLLYRNM